MLSGKKIVLGITGSIAAYKSVLLLRILIKAGAEVKVVCTPSVNAFLGELTLSSLSGKSVFSGIWEENWSEHVELGLWADLMIVAPATANTLAKFAHGLCDNALTAVYLAARCPVMLAPAMDVDMYKHGRTQKNLKELEADGCIVLETGEGFLASGLEGVGRMLEPEEIYEIIESHFRGTELAGKKFLISAGPTQEALDPVRFISNHSSGKMGYALAKAAWYMGADVSLVSGPTQLSPPKGVKFKSVISAQDMFEAVTEEATGQDCIIMAAAVADYTPMTTAEQKIKKSGDDMQIPMKRTKDILKSLGEKKPEGQILVGFAMETENELDNAQKKLFKKKMDFVVLNSLRDKGAGFKHDTNKVTIMDQAGNVEALPLKSKAELAGDILQKVIKLFAARNT
ncbi:MAG: bifunctional phosphopantothenoylcysteine decarboxylase/phosphopantothenate--cysteine ligase CoaBC [Bacteroidia bacterium]|nr:bifunctional phosphopantothenoylcysteine decarboxylase/phosphopantothenate--cysteine ligase CoaBC [Bacteroidia bacterium]